MILTIDIGNTRIKFAQWCEDVIVKRNAAVYSVAESSFAFEGLFGSVEKPSQVFAVCVAGEKMRSCLSDWVRQFWQMDVEFLYTEKKYKNILNAYDDPQQHGADRWAGVVAGHQLHPGCSVCIIGAGTATTFDLVDQSGRHLGGYILPSYATMRESLLVDTANVSASFEMNTSNDFIPDNTSDAVNQGCHKLMQAGIREICQLAKNEMNHPVQIIITGGYAEVFLSYPDMPVMQHHPDLVMQGLYNMMK
jgi:type III pantothenate kinase